MADMLISVLAPTGDKTTDTYLISKGEKGVELTFEDLRTLAKHYVAKGPLYPIQHDFTHNEAFRHYLYALQAKVYGWDEPDDPWDNDDYPNAVLMIEV
jgi:hypothetical protein